MNSTQNSVSDSRLKQISHEEILAMNLPLKDIFSAVEQAFVAHGRGEVEMPAKIGVHTRPGTFIHAMPAYLPSLNICGVKWVSGYPENTARNLPTIAGMLVLNDVDTGLPLVIMDARWITAIRTAVVSALIVKACGRPDANTLAVAGCGVQGRFHVRCMLHVLPETKHVRLYDVHPDRASELAHDTVAWTDAEVVACENPEACLRGADTIATCTSGVGLDVPPGWLPVGGTAVGVDSHVAWKNLFPVIDKFIIDDEPQIRTFEARGKYRGPLPKIHAELGKILTNVRPGRAHERERILGLPLGLAIADMAVGDLIWKRFLAAS